MAEPLHVSAEHFGSLAIAGCCRSKNHPFKVNVKLSLHGHFVCYQYIQPKLSKILQKLLPQVGEPGRHLLRVSITKLSFWDTL